ncbi:S8 family serine peptidase [Limnothrix redekei]|uniref:S8 family serine peptidase n=1 Tax=Limnothrix redekei LRLZ20PSL1 TaxID=3112953 RepID=A0ABW7CHF0_9CYAN
MSEDLDEVLGESSAAVEPPLPTAPIAPEVEPEAVLPDLEVGESENPALVAEVLDDGEIGESSTVDGELSEAETIAESEAAESEPVEASEVVASSPPNPLSDPDPEGEILEFVPATSEATTESVATEASAPGETSEAPALSSPEATATTNPLAASTEEGGSGEPIEAEAEIDDPEDGAETELLIPTALPEPDPRFQSGIFTVGGSGQVVIDVLWDGGAYRGQAGIFSLSGMESYELGSVDFIAEMARRVTSDSVLGYVIWDDPTEAARFSGVMNGEADFNSGAYAGLKSFEMQAGDKFGVVLVPDTTFVKVLEQPWAEGSWRPLFSMVTANPNDSFQMGQIADVTGDGNTFTVEDIRVDHGGDKDYNDFIFQVRGATGEAVLMDEVVAPGKDWRNTDAGQLLVSYAKQYVEAPIEGGVSPSPDGFTGDDGLLPAPPLDFEPSAGEALPNPADGVLPNGASNLPGLLPTYTETRFEFPAENQPVIGIIDTGFAGNNPDFNFSNITWGKDYVSGDLDPTLAAGEGSQHGTHILGVIAAQQDNGIGIDGINPDAPIYAARAIGSGAWAEALTDTVDHIKASGQPNGVVNLSLDLTQRNPDGSITTRYELTPQERGAIEYARQNGVVLVVAASNDPGVMTVLDRAAQEFDNILTVGAAERVNDALAPATAYGATDYSGHGAALDLVADAHHGSVSGLNVAVAKALGGVSQIWAANPDLNHTQVIDILQRTATDLGIPNWDSQTGAGLLNIVAATHLARITEPKPYIFQPGRRTITDQFISQNPANKPLPGDPAHPAAKLPGISATQVDTGSNSLGSATQIWMSPTADIIDQVSNIDPVDIFRVESRYFNGADLSVLDGELSIQYLSPSGQVLSTQVLGKGSHQLQLPSNVGNEVIVKLERRNQNPATYALYGFESAKSEPFNISLEFESPLTPNQQRILEAAAKNVASLIGQGLPTAVVDGKLIDDINIKISTQALDGTGGTQARTKIDFMRYGSLLPAQSLVQLDAADLSRLEQSGNLFDVAQHEFLHALGFGNLWEAKGLVDYAGTPLAAYNGKSAVAAFQNMGGLTDTVSLETDGNGSAGLHWHEGLFADEIMTADLNGLAGKAAPISAVTIASLADLGYVVNLNQATPNYQLATSSTIREVDLTPEQIEAFRALAEMSFDAAEDLGEDYESIAPIMPTVDSDTVAPEIWAHAERFWKNGEYYDWRRYQVQWGDTLSQIALDTMGSAHPDYYWWIANHNGIPNPDWIYKYDWIDIPVHHPNYEWEQEQERLRREEEFRRQQEEEARRRREQEEAFARDQERVRQEEEARRREAEARQRELEEQERRLRAEQERRRQEEELRKERERLAELARQAEIARQQGKGGLDWYLAKPLSFGSADPFEIQMGDVVGNLVPDDYYRFTLSRGGRLTAELKQLLADADLVLYDVRNRPIAYSMREGITDEQIITDLIPGTYMLRVNSPKGVTTDYDLIVKFQHKLSMTQQGPPPGWRVGGSTGGTGSVGGGAGPIFSDPRIRQIYNTALNNFAAAERSKANAQIAQLEAEKLSYQQQLQALLDQMNAEQRAKVHQALDGARDEANVWVDSVVEPVKGAADRMADGIVNQANSIASRLDGAANSLPSWSWWDARGEAKSKIRQAQDAVTGAVNGARSWLKAELGRIQGTVKSAVWQFFETIKNAYRTGGEINQIIANAANTFRRAIDEAVRGANDLVGQFKGRILSAVSWTQNLGIDAFGFKFNAYSQLVEPAVNSIAGDVSSVINGVGNSLKGMIDWLEPRTQKVVADVVNVLLGDQTGQLWNQINGVDAKIAATRTGVEQKIADKASELQAQLNDFLGKLGIDGKQVLDTLINFSNSPVGQIGLAVVEVLLGLIPVVGQAIDIKDTALSLHDILVQGKRGIADFVGLIGALAGWVPLVGDSIKAVAKIAMRGADVLLPLIKSWGPDLTETVIKTISELDWGKILTDLVNDLARRWDDVVRVLNNSADWILQSLGLTPAMAMASGVVFNLKNSADNLASSVNQSKKRLVEPLEDAANETKKKIGLIVGNSTTLGRNLKFDEALIPGTSIKYPGLRGDYQAHHLIPSAVADDSDLMLNAVQYAKFDIDAAVNGIFLPNEDWKAVEILNLTGQSLPIHLGSHPVYSARITEDLNTKWDRLKAMGKTTDPAFLNAAVLEVIESAKNKHLPLLTKPYDGKIPEWLPMPGSALTP